MPKCPDCKVSVSRPERTWTIAGDLNRNGNFFERKVAFYACPQCQSRFPVVAGSTKFKIVHEAEIIILKKKALEGEKLVLKVKEMGDDVQNLSSQIIELNRKIELEQLNSKQTGLTAEVEILKEIRTNLAEELSAFQK